MTKKTESILISIGFIVITILAFITGVIATNAIRDANAIDVGCDEHGICHVYYEGKDFYVTDKTANELNEILKELGE